MQFKEPKAFLIGETSIVNEGLKAMLKHLGIPEWRTDAKSGSEMIIEVGGRLCYLSFDPKLNPNLTRVREGNESYLKNILDSKHGSVLEHGVVTFAFLDVSRVFTHEVVRHRAGTAFSQESLRYVRLADLTAYLPKIFKDSIAENFMMVTFSNLESVQKKLNSMFPGLDKMKKKSKIGLTSAFRRLAPIGLSTKIQVTANHRAWRHIIGMRCNEHAEEEIFMVMMDVAHQLKARYPNIYQDMVVLENGVRFENEKI